MKLTDFAELLMGCISEPTIYVFNTEDDINSFVKDRTARDYELLFTIHSDFKSAVYLKPIYAEAIVKEFYAIGKDQIAVWIMPK